VRTIVTEGPARIEELVNWGVHFDQRESPDGHLEFDLTKEGGHSKRRVLHAADATGREISEKLLAAAAPPNITLLENHFAIDLITTAKLGYVSEDRVLGLYVLENRRRGLTFRSDRVVLATGGCGRVYQYTTNPESRPATAWPWPGAPEPASRTWSSSSSTRPASTTRKSAFLITEAMRGEGGVLMGGRPAVHAQIRPRGSLAPRDIVARAIDREIKRTGGPCVFLDISHKPADFSSHFPPHPQTPAWRSASTCPRSRSRSCRPPTTSAAASSPTSTEPPACAASAPSARSPAPACTAPTASPATRCSKARSSPIAPAPRPANAAALPPKGRRTITLPNGNAATPRTSTNSWSSTTTGTKSAASCGTTSPSCAPTSACSAPPPACATSSARSRSFTGTSASPASFLLELRNLVDTASLIVE
jgi:hypothetical protein